MVTYVIVMYEGSYFPGLVTKVGKSTYEVSCMIRCGPGQWRFPSKPDLCTYEPEDVIEIIQTPTILNSRNIMKCPEVEKYWK